MVPGRWSDARQPTQGELDGTTVLALALDEASAKVRAGPPNDFDRDEELPVWAGVIPLRVAARLRPRADSDGIPLPPYLGA